MKSQEKKKTLQIREKSGRLDSGSVKEERIDGQIWLTKGLAYNNQPGDEALYLLDMKFKKIYAWILDAPMVFKRSRQDQK